MFKVEENLMLTKSSMVPNSYIVENCKTFVPELEGFYVCLTKDRIPAIKAYIETLQNASFILKTFEASPTNGLNLLLSIERMNSYTEEFVKYYSSVQGIFASFAAVEMPEEPAKDTVENSEGTTVKDEIETVTETADTNSTSESTAEKDSTAEEAPADTIDGFDFNLFRDVASDDNTITEANTSESSGKEETPTQSEEVIEESQEISDNQANAGKELMDTEEIMLIIRGIASKLGVVGYDDSKILTKAEMAKAQEAVLTLSTATIREAVIGAIGLAETPEDLAAVTRFLELFFTYVKENGLTR